MVNIHIMNKELRLSWIGRLLRPYPENWKTIKDHFLDKYGGLSFLLKCNYDVKYIDKDLPIFYRNLLGYFMELKKSFQGDEYEKLILFNNKNILIGHKPVFWKEWFDRGILSIQDLLSPSGSLYTYDEFKSKYRNLNTNFLTYYQIISALPKQFVKDANNFLIGKNCFLSNDYTLNAEKNINLQKMKCKNYYDLFMSCQQKKAKGFQKWATFFEKDYSLCQSAIEVTFSLCKDNKIRQSTFKLLHRIVFTRKELFRSKIVQDPFCHYCKEEDSIEHCLFRCPAMTEFLTEIKAWHQISASIPWACEGPCLIFGDRKEEPQHNINSDETENEVNLLLIFLRNYIIQKKTWEEPLIIKDFINQFQNYSYLSKTR